MTLDQHRVRRHPVSLRKNNDIASHDLAASDAFARAIANDQRTRTGKVTQRLQNALGAGFLHDCDDNRECCEGEKDQRFFQISEYQIDHAAADQQRQHRLA